MAHPAHSIQQDARLSKAGTGKRRRFPRGPGMGQYLSEVKGSVLAPSPTCTGGLRPPTPSPAAPRAQLTEAGLGGDVLAVARAGGDEAAAGLRWRFPRER